MPIARMRVSLPPAIRPAARASLPDAQRPKSNLQPTRSTLHESPHSRWTPPALLCTLRGVPRSQPKPTLVGIVFALGLAVGTWFSPLLHRDAPQSVPKGVQAYFSPHGGCTEAIVRQLDAAQSTVLVQAYSFTSAPIAQALVKAEKRGVKVQAIIDKNQRNEQYTEADFLAHGNVPTFIDAKHAIAHNKIMIIDSEVVITGSFNFTKAAEGSNAENLLVIHDPELAARYAENWKRHLAHAEAYVGK